jgi:hypothetical protein
VAKLHDLQQTVDLTHDEASAKALAAQVRVQAGVCLGLLDQYQSSVPGRMWLDAERKCRPLREELRHTEKLFRVNAGEWERRTLTSSSLYRVCDWALDDLSDPLDDVGGVQARTSVQQAEAEAEVTWSPASSREYAEAHHRESLDGLMALVDDILLRDGGVATGPLRFTLPTDGESPGHMLVLVPSESGLVYEHRYGGSQRRHAEVEGFLVPVRAEPEARAALDHVFLVDLGGNGVRDEDRPGLVRTVGDAIERIWYRGTGDRMAPLQIDEERAHEWDEAWVPVVSPDGPAYLVWGNSA